MLRSWLLSLTVASLVVASAAAQAPPADLRPGQIPIPQRIRLGPGVQLSRYTVQSLLAMPVIQKELELTEQQKNDLKKAETRAGQALREATKEPRAKIEAYRVQQAAQGLQMDPDVLSVLTEQASRAGDEGRAKYEADVLAVLNRSQRTRFEQVRLQLEGPMAFRRPDVQERLNLDPATTEQINEILEEAMANQQQLVDKAQKPFAPVKPDDAKAAAKAERFIDATKKARESAQTIRATTMQKIGRLLTKRQRDIYNKALGDPFDSAPLREPKKTDETAK